METSIQIGNLSNFQESYFVFGRLNALVDIKYFLKLARTGAVMLLFSSEKCK